MALADGTVLDYDFLVIATGAKLAWDAVPGLGPKGYSHSIFTPPDAEKTYEAYKKFLENPGPVVIGAVPGASCMGAATNTSLTLTIRFVKPVNVTRLALPGSRPNPSWATLALAA